MVLSANPLALSVPDQAFESWLRDKGYLEILDQRTSDLHRLSSPLTDTSTTSDSHRTTATSIHTDSGSAIATDLFVSGFSYIRTLLSLFTLNPFSKLITDDFAGVTPSWTRGFIGSGHSYSFPSSPSQARLRVHENVKRYARNYASLFILFFACSLYQLPVALVGLISSLALWDLFKFFDDRWALEQFPVFRQSLVHIVQCGKTNVDGLNGNRLQNFWLKINVAWIAVWDTKVLIVTKLMIWPLQIEDVGLHG